MMLTTIALFGVFGTTTCSTGPNTRNSHCADEPSSLSGFLERHPTTTNSSNSEPCPSSDDDNLVNAIFAHSKPPTSTENEPRLHATSQQHPSAASVIQKCLDCRPPTSNLVNANDGTTIPQHKAIIRLQAFVRRFLIRRTYNRILQLQRRLQSSDSKRQKCLFKIQQRKERRLTNISHKVHAHDQKRQEESAQNNALESISHYLQRDIDRLQRDNNKHKEACQDLRRENQRLQLQRSQIFSRIQQVQFQIMEHQHANVQMKERILVYQKVIQELQSVPVLPDHLDQEVATTCTIATTGEAAAPEKKKRNKSSTYASTIGVHSFPVYECDQLQDYQLVQDVYVVTPDSCDNRIL